MFYVGASFRGGGTVQVGDPRNVCRPLGTAGATECLEARVGEALEGRLRSATVELRQWTPGQTLGINPRYTYAHTRAEGQRLATTVHTFEVPIYFMRQVKDINVRDVSFGADLVGGINVGWRSGNHEGPFVVLFLTKAFGLP